MAQYDLVFSKLALKTLKDLKKRDPVRLNKIKELLVEIAENPRVGHGKPERLRHYELREVWSRRINQRDRIVYEIKDSILLIDIISVIGHY